MQTPSSTCYHLKYPQESTSVKLDPLSVTLMLPVWTEMEDMTVNVTMVTLAMEHTVKVSYYHRKTVVCVAM